MASQDLNLYATFAGYMVGLFIGFNLFVFICL